METGNSMELKVGPHFTVSVVFAIGMITTIARELVLVLVLVLLVAVVVVVAAAALFKLHVGLGDSTPFWAFWGIAFLVSYLLLVLQTPIRGVLFS